MKILFSFIFIIIFGGALSFAKPDQGNQEKTLGNDTLKIDDDHSHEKHPGEKDADEHEGEYQDEHKHAHQGKSEHEEAHEEEENSSIGPDKGITLFSQSEGFKLSPEAIMNFDLQTLKLKSAEPWTIPSSAVLYSGEEINVYRVRSGFYKRIDFLILSKNGKDMKIKSPDLKVNDEIVIQGIPFLRSAEIVATGGAPEGHSH